MADQTIPVKYDAPMSAANTLLEVNHLKKHFPITKGMFGKVKGTLKAVDDVSFSIRQGEILGLVGESGCGKTTVGRCIVRAYDPSGGEMRFTREDGTVVDLAGLQGEDLRPYRQHVRMIFQDAYSSLNPRMTVFDNISQAMRYFGASRSEMEDRVAYLLRRVGLRPEYMKRYPHAFSGGERQRISIARALVTNPRLIVADEAVSALDVSVRAQALNLLEELQHDFNLTYLFISHDLSVIRHICHRVVVMYVGQVVEIAEGLDLYTNPKHPYTEALMSAVPITNPVHRDKHQRIWLEGEVPDPANPPSGCYFHPRCNYAQPRCKTECPALRTVGQGHAVACHYAEELNLRGAVMN